MNQTVRNLAIAIALALAGVVLTSSYIKSEKQQLARGKEEVTVLVAKKDIPAGTPAKTLIDGGYVEERDALREDLPPQALGDLKGLDKVSTNQVIPSGDFITGAKFGTRQSLNPADAIKGTQRLASFPINPLGRVADFVQVGDHVDVMACSSLDSSAVDDLPPNVQARLQGQMTADGVATSGICWIAARDLVVEATPASLEPESDDGEAAAPDKLDAKDGPELYAFSGSDNVMMQLLYSYSFSDDTKLFMMLRPSDGDQDSNLPPRVTIPGNS